MVPVDEIRWATTSKPAEVRDPRRYLAFECDALIERIFDLEADMAIYRELLSESMTVNTRLTALLARARARLRDQR
jgi:hypothetical protein